MNKSTETVALSGTEVNEADRLLKNEKAREYRIKNHAALRANEKRYAEKNKAILAVKNKEYRKLHPQKVAAWSKRFREDNKEQLKARKSIWLRSPAGKLAKHNGVLRRRAKKKSCENQATAQQLSEIKAKAKRCHYCGCEDKPLTFDHVIPLDRGGAHSADNLVMACKSCNSTKNAKDPIQFAKEIGRLLI